mmetsp:Transcript_32791/g.71670  ORF Transcript_32791/g.71670 Transcript_32791/m.71670 type:complete len:705 (+) Transcript_32791:96-2210(+)
MADAALAVMGSEVSSGSSSAGQWEHPPSFYCPISQQCMHDPVVLSDGHSYERRHIERWLSHHGTSPVTGAELPQRNLFPNHALRNAIQEYFQQVFSVHRRAIRRSIPFGSLQQKQSLGSNAALLRTIDALMQCSLLVNADLDTERVLRQIMDEAKTLVGAEVASVFLVDPGRKELYSRVNSTGGELRIPITAGIAGHVATTGEPIITHDAYNDERFHKSVDAQTGFKTCGIMCVPLKARRGGVIGVVQLINKTGAGVFAGAAAGWTADELHFLQVFASQATMAITHNGVFHGPREHQAEAPPAQDPEPQSSWVNLVSCCLSRSRSLEPPGRAGADMPESDRVIAEPAEEEVSPQSEEKPERRQDLAEADVADAVAAVETSDGWQLDTLALARLTGNRPLSVLGICLFDRLGLIESLDLDRGKLIHFLAEIERGYDSKVSYHNRAHAASVMHAMYVLLEHGGIAEVAMGSRDGQLERFACLLAAAVHDYEHRGVTNDFLVRTRDGLALRYNDRQVNEQHHAAAAWNVLRRPECDFLRSWDLGDYRRVRSLVVSLVLGTDIADGGALLRAFTEALEAADLAGSVAFTPPGEKEVVLLLQVAMRCADLGHLALNWETHTQWVQRLEKEFFAQGDREKAMGLQPISFLMDRDLPGASKTQVGFLEAVALPLFRSLARASPKAKPVVQAVEANYLHWRDLQAAAAAAPP